MISSSYQSLEVAEGFFEEDYEKLEKLSTR